MFFKTFFIINKICDHCQKIRQRGNFTKNKHLAQNNSFDEFEDKQIIIKKQPTILSNNKDNQVHICNKIATRIIKTSIQSIIQSDISNI